jgi:DNA-binding CsgD family transcriptional regulator
MVAHVLISDAEASRTPVRPSGLAIDFARDKTAVVSLGRRSSKTFATASAAPAASLCDVWFEQDPVPRFVLDAGGRIIKGNAQARDLLGSGVIGAGGLLLCAAHRDRPRLDAVLKRVSQGWQSTGRVLIRGQDDSWCLIEMLGAEAFNGLVVATMRRTADLTPDKIEPLKAVFGLTPVETQVLMRIVVGDAPKEVGRKLSMSIFTVRTHLRTIFMKMGVRGITGTLRLTLQLAL